MLTTLAFFIYLLDSITKFIDNRDFSKFIIKFGCACLFFHVICLTSWDLDDKFLKMRNDGIKWDYDFFDSFEYLHITNSTFLFGVFPIIIGILLRIEKKLNNKY